MKPRLLFESFIKIRRQKSINKCRIETKGGEFVRNKLYGKKQLQQKEKNTKAHDLEK